ncbi:hypothetical protein C0991_006396 [Blastosporella zonata]|nr:hypothetical protein C0991_006396 [Blastosporella zonata]
MPTATFTRKKSNKRQASSDIEEDRPTQRSAEQVDEDDDDPRSRRRANVVKKEKKPVINANRQQIRDDDDEMDNNEDDDDNDNDRIDVDNFSDQPLGKVDVAKLQGLSRDWAAVAEELRPTWNVVGDVAVALADYGEGDDVTNGLAELDRLMKELIDIGVEMQSHENVLDDLAQQIGQGEILENFVQKYTTGVEERKEKYDGMTSRQKYAKNEQYGAFRNNIYEVQYPDTAIPPVTEFIPKEDGDDSDDEDELEMGGISQNYNCPITLTLLVDPVTSEVCKHSFSKAAIMQSFRGSDVIKCPAAGCTKRFSRGNLKLNGDLVKRVKAYERRARRAAENNDAEEIID